MYANSQEMDELVITRTGNGHPKKVEPAKESKPESRFIFADGMPKPNAELIERYSAILDTYESKLTRAIELNSERANNVQQSGLELGEPIVGSYKFWDTFLLGPIQPVTGGFGPYRPHKIIASGEPVFFIAAVVTNPNLIGPSGPSATILMAGWPYRVNLTTMDVTSVTPGTALATGSVFPGINPVQVFLLGFTAPFVPEGSPHILEVNLTVDVLSGAFNQPYAAFATRMLDIDNDPGGLPFPFDNPKAPHFHDEQPLRFLVYNR